MELLKGKKAIITGATRGIGKKIAEVFASNGANLILCGRSDSVKDFANELSSKGITAKAVQGDLKDEACIHEIVTATKEIDGPLDILVNNAGILQPGILGMIKLDSIKETFDVNVISAINFTQYAARLMLKSKSPSIINISSILGLRGKEGVSVYSASKSALVGFTFSAAKELASRNIRVNAIAPGFIDTDMTKGIPEESAKKFVSNIPLKRIGTPEDVANCALFLASDLSLYITGQIIGVDGGMIV